MSARIEDEWLTMREAAELMGVSVRQARDKLNSYGLLRKQNRRYHVRRDDLSGLTKPNKLQASLVNPVGELILALRQAQIRVGVLQLTQAAGENSRDKGFWKAKKSFGDRIALIHSELSEALEEHREGRGMTEVYANTDEPNKPEGIPIELADAVIRIADLCAYYKIDLAEAIIQKMAYNKTRPKLHGKKY